MLEELGVKVHRMQLQVTVRDGGLFIAKQRGVERNTYRIPVKLLDNADVKGYFENKASFLNYALKYGDWTQPCGSTECWDGIRCERFCDVAQWCSKGQLIKSIGGK